MQIIFGGLIIATGAILIGLAYRDKIADAWMALWS